MIRRLALVGVALLAGASAAVAGVQTTVLPSQIVLQPSDAAGASRHVISGDLTLAAFEKLVNGTSADGRARDTPVLRKAGFKLAAGSVYAFPGARGIESLAVELGSPAHAQATAAYEANDYLKHPPDEIRASRAHDPAFPNAGLIAIKDDNFSLHRSGYQLTLARGSYVLLVETRLMTVAATEALMRKMVARTPS